MDETDPTAGRDSSRPLRFLSRRTPPAPQAPHRSKEAPADTACERISAGIVWAEQAFGAMLARAGAAPAELPHAS
jgi:hypothetical protein